MGSTSLIVDRNFEVGVKVTLFVLHKRTPDRGRDKCTVKATPGSSSASISALSFDEKPRIMKLGWPIASAQLSRKPIRRAPPSRFPRFYAGSSAARASTSSLH